MFKFENFPKIKEGYENYWSLHRNAYKLDAKQDKTGSKKHIAQAIEAHRKSEQYAINVFAPIIFDAFITLNPQIKCTERNQYKLNPDTRKYELISVANEYESFSAMFGDNFNNLEERKKMHLVDLITGRGIYRLPKEYYDGVSWLEMERQKLKK